MKPNKLKMKVGFSLGVLSLCCVGLASSLINKEVKQTEAYYTPTTTYTNGDAATYYSSISSSATGDTLLSALRTLNLSKRQKTISYSSMGTSSSSSAYIYTDYDPTTTQTDSNGQTYGTSILSFYSGTSTTSWNREHVWPNSRGGGSKGGSSNSPTVDADIFMPRPTITAENSDRGNSKYVTGLSSSSSGWDPVAAFGESGCYGGTSIRGECARIIFYCMTADDDLVLDDTATGGTTNVTMGKLSDLLQWNLDNPVNSREINRNEGGEYLQGNRNAFVDHPEYACKIWGDYNSDTKAICAASTGAPTKLTMSPTSASIGVGGTVTLTATPDTGSSSVTWTTSNSSVATVAGGVVTGVAAGTATITATSTVDTSISCAATITVKAISSISISGTATTTSYTAGDSFDPTGLTVTATFSDSTTTTVAASACTWTPNPLTTGTTSVTCTYGGKTATYSGITVSAAVGYQLVTDASTLAAGDKLLIGCSSSNVVAGDISSSVMANVSATFSNNTVTSKPDSAVELTLGGSENAWTFANSDGQLLGATAVKKLAWDSGTTTWSISIATGGAATITNGTSSYGSMYYNASSPRFTTYSSAQTAVQLYRKTAEEVAVTGVSVSPTSATVTAGKTTTLAATISPSNATNKNVTWSSSNTSVATVDSTGVVTGVAAGTATITVTTSDGGYTATCAVTVNAAPTLSSISISGTASKTSYYEGDSFDPTGLTVTATYSDSSTEDVTSSVTWTPNPLTEGTTSVTGTYSGKTVTYSGITVSAVSLVSISVSGQSTAYSVNQTFSFDGVCTATYNNGTTATVTPTSVSSPDMSTAGTKTVTVTYGSASTTYEITVSEKIVTQEYTWKPNTTTYTAFSDSAAFISATDGYDSTMFSVTSMSNVRVGSSPDSSAYMFGGSSAGASLGISVADDYIISKIVITGESYSSSTIASIACGNLTKEVSNYASGSTNNYSTFNFYPLTQTATIDTTVGNNKRVFISSIVITVTASNNAASAYGIAFNEMTTTECAALSGISSDTWSDCTTVYNNLTDTYKAVVAGYTANQSGNDLAQAMYRYDMIVSKYSMTNFLSRASASNRTTNINNNNMLTIIIAASIVGISSLAFIAIMAIKKKKEN